MIILAPSNGMGKISEKTFENLLKPPSKPYVCNY